MLRALANEMRWWLAAAPRGGVCAWRGMMRLVIRVGVGRVSQQEQPPASLDRRGSGICLAWEVGPRLALQARLGCGAPLRGAARRSYPLLLYFSQAFAIGLSCVPTLHARVAERYITDDGDGAWRPLMQPPRRVHAPRACLLAEHVPRFFAHFNPSQLVNFSLFEFWIM